MSWFWFLLLFNEWTELEREVNDFKNSINKKKIENKEYYPISFSVFREIFDDEIDLNYLVKKYNNQINDYDLFLSAGKNKRKWIVELPFKIIYNYLKYLAESICNKINDINSKLDIKGIIFVGNNIYNGTLISIIKNSISKIKTYIQPNNPDLSVIEGAVLYGIKSNNVTDINNNYLNINNEILLEKVIAVNFISKDEKINYPMACLSSEMFEKVEERLYHEFPELREKNIYFMANGNIIDKSASLEQNKIKKGNIILINEN